jgi:hypothetical protein
MPCWYDQRTKGNTIQQASSIVGPPLVILLTEHGIYEDL